MNINSSHRLQYRFQSFASHLRWLKRKDKYATDRAHATAVILEIVDAGIRKIALHKVTEKPSGQCYQCHAQISKQQDTSNAQAT